MVNDHLNLDESAEWAGLWWLVEDPDKKVPGILRYDGEGSLELLLIGAFEDRSMAISESVSKVQHGGGGEWDVIHGVAECKRITLFGCIATRTVSVFGAQVKSPDKQIISSKTAVIGAHVNNEDEAVFSGMEMSIDDLVLWADSSVFVGSSGVREGRFDGTASISVEPVGSRSVAVAGNEFCLIHENTIIPSLDCRKGKTLVRMSDMVFMRITPVDPFSMNKVQRMVRMMQDLISLATNHAAGLIWLRVEKAETDSAMSADYPKQNRRAYVLYAPSRRGSCDAKAVDRKRVFFTCDSIPFEEVIPRWCDVHGRLQEAINMVLGLRYAPMRYVENNLLTAVGAAEVLHRCLGIDKKPFPSEEFKEMRNAMLDQVPPEYRDRFKGAIRNDPTLRDRLNGLVERLDQCLVSEFMFDLNEWVKRAVKARNNLTHQGRTSSQSIEELAAIVEITKIVVILNLLRELEVPVDHQHDLARRHPWFRGVVEKAWKWLSSSSGRSSGDELIC